MRRGIRFRLFLIFLGVITTFIVAAGVFLSRKLVPTAISEIENDMAVRVRMASREASARSAPLDDVAVWDAFADSLGRYADVRVTIVGNDGLVIGDSEVETARIPGLENHSARREISNALAAGFGTATRRSVTLHEDLLYVAVPFYQEGKVAGVVRLAVPLTQIRNRIREFQAVVLVTSLVALVLAVGVSSLVAWWTSRSIRALTMQAKQMAAGDLGVRCVADGYDEISQLGAALNQLGGSLSETLNRLNREHYLQERILRGMREGILLLDEEGRIVMVNPALREMLLLGSDAIGHAPIERVRNAELHGLLDRARKTGQDQSGEIEIGGLKPRSLLVHAAVLEGEGIGLLAVFVDMTELRRLETVRKDFVANVSHELRTPIASIAAAIETLRDASESDPQGMAPFIEIIERNALRMKGLVDDLLDLSRIESNEFRLNVEPINVRAATERVLSSFQVGAEAKRIRLIAEIPDNLPLVAADRRALDQILTNFVDNAIKYSPEGAAVTVRGTALTKGIQIAVEDTGPGIDDRHLARLFERFYRVDAGRSRDLGGTGLGLSIVKHLVEAMGGTVAVQSEPGSGSTFTVTLPSG